MAQCKRIICVINYREVLEPMVERAVMGLITTGG
jgi:hypothetical protein